MNKLLFVVFCVLAMPAQAQAIGGGGMEKRLDLGGGYSIPDVPTGQQVTVGGFSATTGAGFDCSGFDWGAQLKNQINLDLSQNDLKNIGSAAIAGSAKYLMASMYPTIFSTVENALKNAHGIVQMAKADCNSIYNALAASDPLEMAAKAKSMEKASADIKGGSTFSDAIKKASEGFNWSLKDDVLSKIDDPKTRGMAEGLLGDLALQTGNGKKKVTGKTLPPDFIDNVDAVLVNDIYPVVRDRIETGQDCDKPLRIEGTKLAKDEKAKPSLKSFDNVTEYALKQISGRKFSPLSCAAIQGYRDVGATLDEQDVIAGMAASQMSMIGLKRTLHDMKVAVSTAQSQKTGAEAELSKGLVKEKIADLENRLTQLDEEKQAERETAVAMLRIRDKRAAEKLAAQAALQRRAANRRALMSQAVEVDL